MLEVDFLMGVICNGPRKSGTNAVRAIVREFGFEDVPGGIIDGQPRTPKDAAGNRSFFSMESLEKTLDGNKTIGSHSPGLVSKHAIISIRRDPKNIAVSAYRFDRKNAGAPVDRMQFHSWLEANSRRIIIECLNHRLAPGKGALVVDYETLFTPETIAAIAKHIGVKVRDVSAAYGNSATWTGAPSKWRDWFLPRAATEFDEELNRLEKVKSSGVVWIMGLSGSGKTTLANAVCRELVKRVGLVEPIDGDKLRERTGLSGFSRAARDRNITQAGTIAAHMEHAGAWVVASLISPFANARDAARMRCKNFSLVYLSTPLKVCESRDPKGLYLKARAGAVKEFTGIDSPFHAPRNADLEIDTSKVSGPAAVRMIIKLLESKGLPKAHSPNLKEVGA